MRSGFMLVAVGLVLGVVVAQENETTTTAKAVPLKQPPVTPRIDVDNIWRFHYEGKKSNGEFLQLADPDGEEGGGRTLVITQIEIRMRQTMRVRLVSHKKLGGRDGWKKEVVRGELLSVGWLDTTSKFMASAYSGWVGIQFKSGTRPSIEFRQGSGDITIYAEGYWAK